MRWLWLPILFAWSSLSAAASSLPEAALKYRSVLVREAQFVFGLNAPVPMLAGQIMQESAWRPGVTAWDNGRGLAQFMDATADTIVRLYPELEQPEPYNPVWAIRAMVRYDKWLGDRVQQETECDRWGAALKAYNAGLGYVQRAQRASRRPGKWFGLTEHIQTRQSQKNFEYSRLYPRWILLKHQPKFAGWGLRMCDTTIPE